MGTLFIELFLERIQDSAFFPFFRSFQNTSIEKKIGTSTITLINPDLEKELDYLYDENDVFSDDFYVIKYSMNECQFSFKNEKKKEEIMVKIFELYTDLQKIPTLLKEEVLSNGYCIYLVNDHLYDTKKERVGGVCIDDKRHIIIDSEDVDLVFLHEFCHAIDFTLEISNQPQFIEIFEKEKNNLMEVLQPPLEYNDVTFLDKMKIKLEMVFQYRHFTQNPEEYFAESAKQYFKNEEKLKEFLPDTWKFLNVLFKSYSVKEKQLKKEK